jgi:hypothetical protein
MIGGDAKPHVPPASRAENACTSSMGVASSGATAAPTNCATGGARQALLSWHRSGLALSAFQNLPVDALRTLRVAVSGPAATPLSP